MRSGDRSGSHEEVAEGLVVLHVEDEINEALTGHSGCKYQSPPQSRRQALTLARVLLGYTGAELNGAQRWRCPIAGGRRTVVLKPTVRSGR